MPKKIDISLGSSKEVLNKFGLNVENKEILSSTPVEMGNLSAACSNYIMKSQYHEYKPNDITVDAVWQFLSSKFPNFEWKKLP